MTEQERNLELSIRWENLYNEDADRMVLECYAKDCTVSPMGGSPIHGHDHLRKVEEAILKAAPRRLMRAEHRHASGDTVIVEAVLLDPDRGDNWKLPFIAVLTCKGGVIVTDRTYADWSQWPGLA